MSVSTASRRTRRFARGHKGAGQDAGDPRRDARKCVLRITGIAVICLATLEVPTSAWAVVPLPDPPSTVPSLEVSFALYALGQDYRLAPLAEKPGIHNEILLLSNIACPML